MTVFMRIAPSHDCIDDNTHYEDVPKSTHTGLFNKNPEAGIITLRLAKIKMK